MNNYISPLKTDYSSKYDDTPRMDLLNLITEVPERVFEIGCGAGATGKAFKQKFKDIEFIGLEPEEKAAEIAQTRLDKVIRSDIEKVRLDSLGLIKEYFDLIICADVLEHLYDPWKTIFTLRDYLKPNGSMLASIPNIQNIDIINKLVDGHWTYSKYGLLDATHIRFFTLNEITKMFTGTGFKIIQCSHAKQSELDRIKEWPTDIDFGKIVLKNVTREEASKLFVFQYFIIAQKTPFLEAEEI
ncbi:MAG: class I SAM-dependent methyltransferase [Candidatus Scalindua sp.]|jgi:2-polyprenyl-3-methyl-5-hydroxy-6-metoxy-1,4-benzoquinol methylase|nr:class I SAM-dependent methyltransferase [Candidatus Scalindua sp.]MBT6563122.1 class I SAM-dependent methyltransferase [Candidatus Scalindua sp.]MBT7213278.1 class I SAM-dependent methyltransferase [Candidatus Scalindua sp.]MBT7591059.1 class I SAM-dependent methyltransferase [Candidatus Scalindua sp.]